MLSFQNPSPCDGFFKIPLHVRSLSKPLAMWCFLLRACMLEGWVRFLTRNVQYRTFYIIFWVLWRRGTSGSLSSNQACMYVCMYVCMLYVWYVCLFVCMQTYMTYMLSFQNQSPCEGFFKTLLPVRDFLKPLSLWWCLLWACMFEGRVWFLTKNVQCGRC